MANNFIGNIASDITGTAASTPTERGPGDYVKEQYDAALNFSAKKLWQGMLQVGASGFGKGMIAAAIVAIAFWTVATVVGAPVPEAELMNGMIRGVGYLATTFEGLAFMAFGGTIGAVAETIGHQNKLSAAQAQLLAKQYEVARQQEQARRLEPAVAQEAAPEKTTEIFDKPEKCFTACELERRAKAAETSKSPEGYGR